MSPVLSASNGTLYFVQRTDGAVWSQRLATIDLEAADVQTLFDPGLDSHFLIDVSYDPIAQRVFWMVNAGFADQAFVRSADLDGDNAAVLAEIVFATGMQVYADPRTQHVYYGLVNNLGGGAIMRVAYDGVTSELIYQTPLEAFIGAFVVALDSNYLFDHCQRRNPAHVAGRREHHAAADHPGREQPGGR